MGHLNPWYNDTLGNCDRGPSSGPHETLRRLGESHEEHQARLAQIEARDVRARIEGGLSPRVEGELSEAFTVEAVKGILARAVVRGEVDYLKGGFYEAPLMPTLDRNRNPKRGHALLIGLASTTDEAELKELEGALVGALRAKWAENVATVAKMAAHLDGDRRRASKAAEKMQEECGYAAHHGRRAGFVADCFKDVGTEAPLLRALSAEIAAWAKPADGRHPSAWGAWAKERGL